ncbi:MAG TPA: methyl-accepting chemotaxis protein [Savagea sp.]
MNDWSIRTKLFSSIAFILVVTIVVMNYLQIKNVTNTIEGEALEKAQSDLNTTLALIDSMYPGEWELRGEELYKGETLMNHNYDLVDLVGEMTNGDTATLFARDISITSNVMVEGERGVGTKVIPEVAEAVLERGELFLEKADVLGHTYQTAYTPIRAQDGTIVGMWYIGAPDASERIVAIKNRIQTENIISGIIIVILAFGSFYLLVRPLLARITTVTETLERVADGDLTVEVPPVESKDETGQLITSVDKMVQQLSGVLNDTHQVSLQVASSSEELTASTVENTQAVEQVTRVSNESVQGAKEQQNIVDDAIRIVDGLSQNIDTAIAHSDEVANIAQNVALSSEKGMEAINVVTRHMEEIDANVGETSTIIQTLNERAHEINSIISIITDISEQTNLLALNAAIESARAGESGKGFAVVANEVRKLAEQSSQSSERIAQLIVEIQKETGRAVRSMQLGTEKTKAGIEETHSANARFIEVNDAIAEVTPKATELSQFIQDVANQNERLVRLIEQVGQRANENVAQSLESSAAAEEQLAVMEEISKAATNLSSLSDDMTRTLQRFKMNN